MNPNSFDSAIEPLAIALRAKKDVLGIWRGKIEHKVSLYADDLVLFISIPTMSLPPALSLFYQFGELSSVLFFGVFEIANLTALTGWQWSYMLMMSLPHLLFLDPHFHSPELNPFRT